jgi:hypothetical protein
MELYRGCVARRRPVMKPLNAFALLEFFLIYDQPQAQSNEETGDYDSKEECRHPHSVGPMTA